MPWFHCIPFRLPGNSFLHRIFVCSACSAGSRCICSQGCSLMTELCDLYNAVSSPLCSLQLTTSFMFLGPVCFLRRLLTDGHPSMRDTTTFSVLRFMLLVDTVIHGGTWAWTPSGFMWQSWWIKWPCRRAFADLFSVPPVNNNCVLTAYSFMTAPFCVRMSWSGSTLIYRRCSKSGTSSSLTRDVSGYCVRKEV
jgi:hypothetical protein